MFIPILLHRNSLHLYPYFWFDDCPNVLSLSLASLTIPALSEKPHCYKWWQIYNIKCLISWKIFIGRTLSEFSWYFLEGVVGLSFTGRWSGEGVG